MSYRLNPRLFALFAALVVLQACVSSDNAAPADEASEPPAAASDAPGYRIYVTNERSGNLSIIDSATHEVVATVPLGKRPRGIHASPDGQTIYVALSGSPIAGPGVDESTLPPADKSADGIGVFDVKTNTLLKVIKGGSDPEEFDLSKDGTHLYISNEDVAEATVWNIAAEELVETFKVGEEPEGVTTSPDGKFVYVTSENEGTVTVIDTAAHKVVTTFEVGHRPRDTAFSPDGSKAYVSLENDGAVAVIDAVKHRKIKEISVGAAGTIKPMAVTLTADGTKAYVSSGRGKNIYVIDTATDMVTGSVEVGDRPWGIALSPDGRFLYSANGPSNDVSVVDLESMTVVKKIKAGDSPWGVITLAQ
jgi:YVTN family beta-propeller protein